MSKLSLNFLGSFQVTLADKPLTTFRSDKERALLAYLAMEADQPQRRESLAGLFWAELPEDAALNNLRKALHHLRQLLDDEKADPPFLIVTAKTIQFNSQSQHRLDVTEFLQAVATTRLHRHRHPNRCQVCHPNYLQAAKLYRGDFLKGFSLPDSIAFDEWLLVRREQFRLQALEGLQLLANFSEWRGEWDQLYQYAQRQVEIEPWRESAYRQLMRALVHKGNRAAALAQYEICRRTLQSELAIEPESETTALYDRLRQGQPWETVSGPPHNLPSIPTAFIGRSFELTRLGQSLADTECRLLTLIGPGGVGKTRLALQAAWEHLYDFEHGVYFVNLDSLTDPSLVIGAVAQTLGVTESGGVTTLDALKTHLRDKELLLVLDNFEQVLPAALTVADLLVSARRLVVLVTSREALRLSGEHQFPVPPLDLPPTMPAAADALLSYSAIQLFVQRARAAQPDYDFSLAEAQSVWAICQRLAGLPLAIELAAARVTMFSSAEILEKLSAALHILTEGARDLPSRQQTLRDTIAWSYNLLADGEKFLFRQLAIFLGGSSLTAIQSVSGFEEPELRVRLRALLDKNLLRQRSSADDPDRFEMLDTIREFGREQLVQAGELLHSQQQHATYFAALASEAEPQLTGSDQQLWFGKLDQDHDNLRAALRWLLINDRIAGARTCASLWRFWDARGHLSEGRRWLAEALADSDDLPAELRAKVLNGSGMLAWYQTDYAAARDQIEASYALRKTLGDKAGMAIALNNLGLMAWGRGDYDSAKTLFKDCLELDRESGDRIGSAYSLGNLGLVVHHQGHYPEAQTYFEESRAIFKEFGNVRHEAMALHNLGMAYYFQGNYAAARDCYETSLKFKEELADKWGQATTLTYFANLCVSQGDLQRARAMLLRSLSLNRELGGLGSLAEAFDGFAALAAADGQGHTAARLFGAAENLRTQSQTFLHAADRLERDRHAALALRQIGATEFESTWAAGRGLPLEQLLKMDLK
jgi:predicted ATPase/DNA-binding SARP family transcriptional activator/Tfp pilus assembly protein PilF